MPLFVIIIFTLRTTHPQARSFRITGLNIPGGIILYIYIYMWQFAASPLSRSPPFAKGEKLARGGCVQPCAEGGAYNLARATLRGGIPVRVRTAVQTRGFYNELASKL